MYPVYDANVSRYQSDQFVARLADINRRMDEIRNHAQHRLADLEQRRAHTPPPRMGSGYGHGSSGYDGGRYGGGSGSYTPPPRSQSGGGHGGSHSPFNNHKALLIGINYTGTSKQLSGCANDARALQGFLRAQGWSDQHMRVLTDDNMTRGSPQPTHHTILQHIRWLVEGARPGDCLFFSFSGHGKQIRDYSGEERDGLDECLLSSDGGTIKDDDLYQCLVAPLQRGVKLTCVIDACHSGTVLDLPYSFGLRGDRQNEGGRPQGQGVVVMLSGCQDHQETADIDYSANSGQADGGAMTQTLLQILGKGDPTTTTWRKLIEEMHFKLAQRGFPQRPQLSTNSPSFDPDYPVSLGLDNSPIRKPQRRTQQQMNGPRTPQRRTGGYGSAHSSPYSSPYSSPMSAGFGSPGYSTGSSAHGSPYDRRFLTRPALPSTSPSGSPKIRSRNYFGGGGGGGGPDWMGAMGEAYMNDGAFGLDDAPGFAETALGGTPFGLAAGQFNDAYGQEGTGWGGVGNGVDQFVDGYTGNNAYGDAAEAAVGGFANDWKFGVDDFQNVGSAYQEGGGQWGDGLLGNVGEAYADDGQFGLDEMGDIYGGFQDGGWW